MNDTVTILGRVGGDPNRSETTTGIPVVNFRVASPQGWYDAKSQTFIETGTNWYNVSAFRRLAEHAKVSLRSGDAVIVTGRLKLREWESGGKKGMSADIDADALGHDLRWGTAAFAKAPTANSSTSTPTTPDAASSTQDQDTDGLEDDFVEPSAEDRAEVWNVTV
ncbi:single-stranded DNA-binding protein [Microbacterium sp. KHB019]|uniref:single-stranded DNA-binding protein n=1 Tax=Microbacterium sp. KHB019 TaxID=3129770 RepID=UPI003079BBE4